MGSSVAGPYQVGEGQKPLRPDFAALERPSPNSATSQPNHNYALKEGGKTNENKQEA
jgi:hypothetical protein